MNLTCLFRGHRWQAQRCTRCGAWRTMSTKRAVVRNVHQLKIWPEYFDDIVLHNKRFEVRKGDRPFAVGDGIRLNAWDPIEQRYTGHACTGAITYILPGGQHGIQPGYVVIGFKLHTILTNHQPHASIHALPIP